MIRRFQPTSIPRSAAPFSQVVMDDRYAYLSGLVAADFAAGQAVLGEVAAETRAVMTALEQTLSEIGLGMDRVVRVEVHLTSLDDFDSMDGAYREFFRAGEYPARTTTESRRLFGGSRVEVTCMARL